MESGLYNGLYNNFVYCTNESFSEENINEKWILSKSMWAHGPMTIEFDQEKIIVKGCFHNHVE